MLYCVVVGQIAYSAYISDRRAWHKASCMSFIPACCYSMLHNCVLTDMSLQDLYLVPLLRIC
jgi:hypothetical protein